ncbi:MAG: hypothetical protein ACJ8F7_06685 [Gemmataceae bacterium]
MARRSDRLVRMDEFEEIPFPFDRRAVGIQDYPDAVEAYFFVGDASRAADVGDSWPATAS